MSTKRSLNRCKSVWVTETDYWKHSLAVSDYLSKLFLVWAKINRHWVHTLIKTSAIRDFISPVFTKKIKIPLQKKSNVYKVTAVDNKLLSYNNKLVDHKTEEITL